MTSTSFSERPLPSVDYENYSETSSTYDSTRRPIGIEIILGCFAATNTRPLHEQIILDAGCGTGNYIQAIHQKVSACYGIDVNDGMLAQARRKFEHDATVILDRGNLLHLPYPTEFFDGVMCNQVIHHLDEPSGSDDFPNVQIMMASVFRVLRSQGVFVINTCSHRQLRDGYWWADLIPHVVEKMAARIPTFERIETMLEAVGFRMGGILVPLHEVLQGPSYFNPEGPLRKSFRDGDSTWALLTQAELDSTLARIREMNEDGSIVPYLEERERRRKRVGQTTFIFARKP